MPPASVWIFAEPKPCPQGFAVPECGRTEQASGGVGCEAFGCFCALSAVVQERLKVHMQSTSSDATTISHHITVCICTFKRPQLLRRLLGELGSQDTNGLFTYSIVLVDNDQLQSARVIVSDFAAASPIPIQYFLEPRQSIALARNLAVGNASGDFVAFIDDDEFPSKSWLLALFKACNAYDVDGVLGPVRRHFDERPPEWIVRGSFYERPVHPTGMPLNPADGRTGNALVKSQVFTAGELPFRTQFRCGSDQDFFRRMIEKEHVFIWSADAVVYEVVPPIRWKRTFMLKRAFFRGAHNLLDPTRGVGSISKSVIAVPAYLVALPVALLLGQHRFMDVLVRLSHHLGKLSSLVGINPIKDQYITE
jgi:succinoglycan biosynthesis protein ExoM